jgi:hypothetical protein
VGEAPRIRELAEGVRFELTRERNPLPVFKTGALNHSATLPGLVYLRFYRRTFQSWRRLLPAYYRFDSRNVPVGVLERQIRLLGLGRRARARWR